MIKYNDEMNTIELMYNEGQKAVPTAPSIDIPPIEQVGPQHHLPERHLKPENKFIRSAKEWTNNTLTLLLILTP